MDYILALCVANSFFIILSNNIYLKVIFTTLLVILYFSNRKGDLHGKKRTNRSK